MNHPIFLLTFLLTVQLNSTLAARKPASDGSANTPPGKSDTYKQSAGKSREMEFYFPPNHDPAKSKVPGMILFHGGGWSGGSQAMLREQCAYFASHGLVCSTPEYQMVNSERSKLPDGESKNRVCVVDAKSAIRWFKQHAEELGIDSQRIITGDGSAGGHLSAPATGEKLIPSSKQ